jgi:prophage tail gpP-like protein
VPAVDPKLTVRFQAQGRDTDRIQSWWIDSDYLTSTDGFEFVYFDEPRDLMRGLMLEPVELSLSTSRVSGAQQCLGRIDITEIGGGGSEVKCQGRDYIADMVECGIDPLVKVNKNTTIAQAMVDAMGPVGIKSVGGEGDLLLRNIRTGKAPGNAGAGPDFSQARLEDLKPKPGQGIYEFCNRLAARNGATIQPSNDRSIIYLSTPDYQQEPLYRIQCSDDRPEGFTNTIVRASAREDGSRFPTFMFSTGKGPSGKTSKKLQRTYDVSEVATVSPSLAGQIDGKVIVGRVKPKGPDAAEADGRLYRFLYHKDEEARNTEQLDRVSSRRFSELLAASLTYNVTLKGFEDEASGALYAVNTTIEVKDSIRGVDETLWIKRRRFSYQPGQGAQTELECIRLGSLIL